MAKTKQPKSLDARFQLILDGEVLALLDKEADDNDRSRSGQIRHILRDRYGLLPKSEEDSK